jgi:hypothetical protein
MSKVSENRILRKTLGTKREKLAGGWKRLHNEELRNLYASPDIISGIKSRRMKWAGHIERIEDMKNAYSNIVGKPEWKRKLGILKCRWENNIGIYFREIGCEGVDWMRLNIWVLKKAGNFLTS